MKKALILTVIVFMSMGLAAQIPRLDPGRVPTDAITLISPGNEGYFNAIPVKIVFRWRKTPGVLNYTFVLQVKDGEVWKTSLARPNLTVDHITITYNHPSDLRWQVLGVGPRGVRYQSPWWVLHYGGAAASTQGGTTVGGDMASTHVVKKPKPKFHPVPVSPKAGVVLRNYPRTMTFTWLHSTNPQFRHYQIQVDIYHPNPAKWQSEMRKNKLLVDTMVKGNEYPYKFPADRDGRWRVRGVNNNDQATPWSAWHKFSFRARH